VLNDCFRTGHEFEHIVHHHRFSDLHKSLAIVKPGKTSAEPLQVELEYLHPWASLTLREFKDSTPPDISFSPRDCYELYQAMEFAVASRGGPATVFVKEEQRREFIDCHPDKFFQGIVILTQRRCRQYEVELKRIINGWIATNGLKVRMK